MFFPLAISVFLLAGHAVAVGPREQCVGIWNVLREGQTCQTISHGVGVPISWLLAHNPDLVCNGQSLPVGTRVCTLTFTPTCESWDVATQATCETDPILHKWNLTKDQFVQLNDDVDESSCALNIGQEYCVKPQGDEERTGA